MADAPEDIAALSFEQALSELEKIVAQLESGQAPLEESIALYERGAVAPDHDLCLLYTSDAADE